MTTGEGLRLRAAIARLGARHGTAPVALTPPPLLAPVDGPALAVTPLRRPKPTNLGINSCQLGRLWRRAADEMHNFYQRNGPSPRR